MPGTQIALHILTILGYLWGGAVPDDQSQKLKNSPLKKGAVPVELYGRQIRLLLTGGY